MKKFIIVTFAIFLSLNALAQLEVKEDSFKEVPGFVNTNPDPDYQTDDNFNPFAIIKILTENLNDKQRRELLFQGNAATYILCEYKEDAIWVYLTAVYANYIKISHPDFSSIEFDIPVKLKPNQGYEMTITNTNVNDAKFGSINITTEPSFVNASITLDGNKLNKTTPYSNDMISAGKHEITISLLPYYETTTKTIEIKEGEHLDVTINMRRLYGGPIRVETTPPGATVGGYGITPLTIDSLTVGEHRLNLEKDGLKMLSIVIFVEQNKPIIVKETFETCPVGAINGVFSVSNNKQVYFSKGNLQYQPSTKKWRFAEQQGDFIGKDNNKASKKNNRWVDWFAWNTANNPMSRSKKSEDYKGDEFVDWGHNPISNGGNTPDMWHTLTKDEWEYLFKNRQKNSHFAAIVNGVYGVVLLPDNWDPNLYDVKYIGMSDGAYWSSEWPGGFELRPSESGAGKNVISLSEWKNKFEANGAVFLPAAGYYGINAKIKTDYVGFYWAKPNKPYEIYVNRFKKDRFTKDNKFKVDALLLLSGDFFDIYPENRMSVRLVH